MFGDLKLRKRVSDLEESLARIEHSFKQLQVEWTETYDKFRQLHWRVAKRAKQLEEASAELGEATPTPPGDQGLTGSAEGQLTPKQLEAQRSVLARRNRRLVGAQNGGE
jgi:chromosome segregation ATPase